MAAYWLQNLFWVQTLLSPLAPWTVSTKWKERAALPDSYDELSDGSRRGGMQGYRVKITKASRLQRAIVRRRDSKSWGFRREISKLASVVELALDIELELECDRLCVGRLNVEVMLVLPFLTDVW